MDGDFESDNACDSGALAEHDLIAFFGGGVISGGPESPSQQPKVNDFLR